MKRLFWLSVGAGAGIYATHRVKRGVQRFARTWSPEGVAARAVGAGQGAGNRLKLFASDVRTEMQAREAQLREAVRMDQAPPETGGPRPRRILTARYTIVDDRIDEHTDHDKDGH